MLGVMSPATPPEAVIVEVAVNGTTTREANPHVPRTPAEITGDMLACLGRWITVLKYSSEILVPLNTALIVGICTTEPAAYLISACLPPCSSIVVAFLRKRGVRKVLRMKNNASSTHGLHALNTRSGQGFDRLHEDESAN